MIGTHYWSVGITVWQVFGEDRDEWSARADFQDDGFCDLGSSEGQIRSRYVGPLATVVDLVKADADRLGIVWVDPRGTWQGEGVRKGVARVYYRGDGEHSDIPPAPLDWRERVNAESRRIGWAEAYQTSAPQEVKP